jgi:hypothetical protein
MGDDQAATGAQGITGRDRRAMHTSRYRRDPKLDATAIEREIRARDADVTRPFGKDF